MAAQRLDHMTLGTGHHQPAAAHELVVSASAAAMPMSGAWYGAAVPSQLGYQSYTGLFAPPPMMLAPIVGQVEHSEFLTLAAVNLANKSVKLDGAQEITTNKRNHDEQSSLLAAAHAQQQMIIVDHNLRNHAAKMWISLREQRRRDMNLVISTMEATAEKQLEAKDQEIQHSRSLNRAHEELLRTLFSDAQAWRNIAQSNEILTNVLRADLQQVLAQQAVRGVGNNDGDGEKDVGSWSRGKKHMAFYGEEEVKTPVAETPVIELGMCKGCGESAPVVLLLPCRHLCVCVPCAEAARSCPSCGCAKNGSIHVNFS